MFFSQPTWYELEKKKNHSLLSRLFSIWKSSIRISSNWNTPRSHRCCPLTWGWAQRDRCAHSHLGSRFRPVQPNMTPWDSSPPSGSKLSRQDVALILGPLQKISLGKPSHDSWALQWQLSVDSTEKSLNGKYSGEDLMRKPGVCWEPSWRELKLCQIASHFKRRGKKKNHP